MTPTQHRCLIDASHGDPHVFGTHHSRQTIGTLVNMGCLSTSDHHLSIPEREYWITEIGVQTLQVMAGNDHA